RVTGTSKRGSSGSCCAAAVLSMTASRRPSRARWVRGLNILILRLAGGAAVQVDPQGQGGVEGGVAPVVVAARDLDVADVGEAVEALDAGEELDGLGVVAADAHFGGQVV